MDKEIEKIKDIMLRVSTEGLMIQDANKEYKKLYSDLDEYFSNTGIENPNPHSDLWEFYTYWSKKLKTYAERRAYISSLYKKIKLSQIKSLKIKAASYVDFSRLRELKSVKSKNFDLCKLISFCEELNFAFNSKSYLSTCMIIRAIIDHVPPIFNSKSFTEIYNNHSGTKSFKESMSHLDKSSRRIADSYLHTQIRNKESLPNQVQVDFSNDLDVLLAEIYRILK
jgi:hypothetical protein